MQGFRFSLSTILGLTLVVAISFAAITINSSFLRWLLELLSVCLILMAALHMFYNPREKPFWGGFFIFSVGRALLAMMPEYNMMRGLNTPTSFLREVLPDDYVSSNVDDPIVTAWLILFGAIGGCLAVIVHSRRESNDRNAAERKD